MTTKATVQVLTKADPSQQTLLDLSSTDQPPLKPSSVRVRTFLIGLTANNLSYASSGSVLHWWDTFPVPSIAPEPYNDASIYGIVPAWGYAEVLESTIQDLHPHTIFWGMFPTSTVPVDLLIVPAKTPGHWTEFSPHRNKVMPLYQRYIIVGRSRENLQQAELDKMALRAIVRPTWQAGYLLNRVIFPVDPNQTPIHPLGTGLPWTHIDSDLSSAALVSLGAGSKTAKSFAYQLATSRPKSGGPLGFIEVAGSGSFPDSSFSCPSRIISYDALTSPETLSWIDSLAASRVVILDFGGRDNAVEKIYDALSKHEFQSHSAPQITIINIGKEMKLYSPADLQASAAAIAKLGKVQMNTSGVAEAVMETLGEERYNEELMTAWEAFRDDAAGGGKTRVVWGEGMRGDDGVEGGWGKLCNGKTEAGAGMAFRL